MRQPDRGNGVDAEQLGGFDPPVTGDDLILVINKDRIAEAKSLDAIRDLTDLLFAVRPRIVRVGPQLADKRVLDVHWRSPFLFRIAPCSPDLQRFVSGERAP